MLKPLSSFSYCHDVVIGKQAIEYDSDCVLLPIDSGLGSQSAAYLQFLAKYPDARKYLTQKFKSVKSLPLGAVYSVEVEYGFIGVLAVVKKGGISNLHIEDIKMALESMLIELDQCGYTSITIPPMAYDWDVLCRVIVDTLYDRIDYVNIVCPNGHIVQMVRPSTLDTQKAYEATVIYEASGKFVVPNFPKYKLPKNERESLLKL